MPLSEESTCKLYQLVVSNLFRLANDYANPGDDPYKAGEKEGKLLLLKEIWQIIEKDIPGAEIEKLQPKIPQTIGL